jgi:hypothetical protein
LVVCIYRQVSVTRPPGKLIIFFGIDR